MAATTPLTILLNILLDAGINISTPSFDTAQFVALGVAILCLILSGFVSGSEISFFSLSDSQLEELDQTPKGTSIRRLLSDPQRFLATILIANNLVNVTIVVLTNFALGPVFDGMSPVLSFILQTVLLTFLILLFGEIIPKLYANNNNIGWASLRAEHTEGAAGDDKEMLEGILKFGDTTASEIMTPRVELTDLSMDLTFEQVMKVVLDSGYSRMPVYEDTQDDIKGILYSRDLLPYIGKATPAGFEWQKLLRQAYFVPESRQIDDLLEDFRRLKIHMAIVVDEFGGTQGVVTLEDVLEEIVGDIDDEYDEPDTTFRRLRDDTYEFEGRTPLTDFFRITDLNPDDYNAVTQDVETLAGMLLAIKGDFPKDKEPLVYGRCRFLILEISDHRINEVRVKVMPENQDI